MQLKDKVAIVTGAAKGIGLAIAKRYVAEGAKVMLADLNEPVLLATARTLGMPHCVCDVSIKSDVDRMVGETVRELGKLDIMMSCAGVHNKLAQFIDIEEDEFDRIIRINLKSQFLCGQAAARQMILQGHGGAIINMASINARIAIPTLTPYAVAKAGSVQLTNVMAISLAEYNIRVNAIGPGTILDDVQKEKIMGNDFLRKRILSRTPLKRAGIPEEIAGVAVFLAAKDSSYITGQTLYADGGRLGLNLTMPLDEDD